MSDEIRVRNAAALRKILVRVRQELSFLHGVWVTDQPDLVRNEGLLWQVNTEELGEEVDGVLRELFGTENLDS